MKSIADIKAKTKSNQRFNASQTLDSFDHLYEGSRQMRSCGVLEAQASYLGSHPRSGVLGGSPTASYRPPK